MQSRWRFQGTGKRLRECSVYSAAQLPFFPGLNGDWDISDRWLCWEGPLHVNFQGCCDVCGTWDE